MLTFTGTGGRITVELFSQDGPWLLVRDPVTGYFYMAEPEELTPVATEPKQLDLAGA